jgi:NAD(P)-dependent dehydrogenase (short-subunit alcohol dehydrogenase family)
MNSQRVLVTAGAAGIGREIVRPFTAGGAAVFVCDLSLLLSTRSPVNSGGKTANARIVWRRAERQ